jgi:hypothetical protein
MAKPIGFSAFLKLLELSDGPRKTELKKKLGGGAVFSTGVRFKLPRQKRSCLQLT